MENALGVARLQRLLAARLARSYQISIDGGKRIASAAASYAKVQPRLWKKHSLQAAGTRQMCALTFVDPPERERARARVQLCGRDSSQPLTRRSFAKQSGLPVCSVNSLISSAILARISILAILAAARPSGALARTASSIPRRSKAGSTAISSSSSPSRIYL